MRTHQRPFSFQLPAFFLALAAASAQTQAVPIVDPVLQMTAWTVHLPSNWKASGTMMGGSACTNTESPVLRAISPDGLTGMYFLPRIDWCWGAGTQPGRDSFANRELSAKEIANFMMQTRKLAFVQDVPTEMSPAQLRESDARLSHPGFVFRSDNAKTRVRYELNGVSVDEILQVNVSCREMSVMAVGSQHACSAFVVRKFAPTRNFEAVLATFDTARLTLNDAWNNAWNAMMTQNIRAMYQKQTEIMLENGRRAEAARMQQHQEFMNYMQHRSDQLQSNFEASQYRKQQNKEDFVDYVLDCQRYYGQNVRVDSGNCQNRQTW